MKKYRVGMTETVDWYITVEAQSAERAQDIARTQWEEDGVEGFDANYNGVEDVEATEVK